MLHFTHLYIFIGHKYHSDDQRYELRMLYRPWIAQHYDKPTGERPALGHITIGPV